MGDTNLQTQIFTQRVKNIQKEIDSHSLDGLVIFNEEFRPSQTMFFSDYCPVRNVEFSPSVVFIDNREIILFLGSINMGRAKEVSWIEDIRDIQRLPDFLSLYKENSKIAIAGIEKIPMYYKKYLDNCCNTFVDYDFDTVINNMRLIKEPEEIEAIKKSCNLGIESLKAMINTIEYGVSTEYSVAAVGENHIRSQGHKIGYDTIISCAENTIDKTWRPSNRVIEKHEIVVLNIVAKINEYPAFLTITHPSENVEAKKICKYAKEIIAYMIDTVTEGDCVTKIFESYSKKVKEFSLEKHFLPPSITPIRLGSSTGLDVIEKPTLYSSSNFILEKNMVLLLQLNLNDFSFGDCKFDFIVQIDKKMNLLCKDYFSLF